MFACLVRCCWCWWRYHNYFWMCCRLNGSH